MGWRKYPYWFVSAYVLAVSSVVSAPFVPPADGPVPFRRDRVPLDPHSISELSQNLLVMVNAMDADTPEKRRAVAQMLAVALALNPGSEMAKKLIKEIPERDFEAEGDDGESAKRRKSIWQVIQWLETPEAGIDGQALAACLKDLMVVVNPEHSRVEALRGLGEQAAWTTWVPPLSAYEDNHHEERLADTDEKESEEKPEPDEPNVIRLPEATLPVLLWKEQGNEGSGVWKPVRETLRMKAYVRHRHEPDNDEEGSDEDHSIRPLHVSVGSWGDNEDLRSVAERAEGLLTKRYSRLPDGLVIEIRNDHLDRSIASGERHALSGVCALLADAAISGEVPDAMVLGVMDGDGRFSVSVDYWSLIQALLGEGGLKLIVPAEAEEIVSAFLALERPDFFLKNEVMMAGTMDDIVALCAKSPKPPLDAVHARFREIRDKQGSQDVRVYVGNSFIRQRLQALLQEEPRHLSAKMLVIQSAGNRPTKVSRMVTASELRQVMKTMLWVRNRDYFAPGNRDLTKVFDDCRAGIDGVARLAGKDAQELIDAAVATADTVRDLDRSARNKRGEYWEIEEEIRSKKRALDSAYDEFDEMVRKVLDEKT